MTYLIHARNVDDGKNRDNNDDVLDKKRRH